MNGRKSSGDRADRARGDDVDDRQEKSARNKGTVSRAVHLLRVISEAQDSMSVTEIGSALDLPLSTTHRLLDLLLQEDFISYHANTRRYSIGNDFFRVASLVVSRFNLVDFADSIMGRLCKDTGETVVLTLYNSQDRTVYYARTVNSPNALGYRLELNRPLSPLWGATGRAVLAFLDQESIGRVREEARPSPVAHLPVPSSEGLDADLKAIRDLGYARSRGEKVAGSASIAMPVFDVRGRPVASLAITMPEFRFHDKLLDLLLPPLSAAAKELSALVFKT